MIYKLQLWIRSSKVSSSCTQCSDRKYSFSSSATSWFRTPTSDVPKQQMKTPAKRRTGEVTASNVSTEQTWCTGESLYTGESITSESAYRIQTFNTTNWYTGESAYTGESITMNRRIRFQRSTNRLAQRRISVHRWIDYHLSAYQIPTSNTTDWYTGEAAYRRPASGESPFQIPTFNTTDWYTGEAAYRRPANRRIRFQRSTQQIGTPAKRRTGDRRPATGESPYQRPT